MKIIPHLKCLVVVGRIRCPQDMWNALYIPACQAGTGGLRNLFCLQMEIEGLHYIRCWEGEILTSPNISWLVEIPTRPDISSLVETQDLLYDSLWVDPEKGGPRHDPCVKRRWRVFSKSDAGRGRYGLIPVTLC